MHNEILEMNDYYFDESIRDWRMDVRMFMLEHCLLSVPRRIDEWTAWYWADNDRCWFVQSLVAGGPLARLPSREWRYHKLLV